MRFTKILGNLPDNDEFRKVITQAEDKLSSIFTELSVKYDNKAVGTGLGGDSLIFQLVYPLDHICDARELYLKFISKDIEQDIKDKIAAGEFASLSEEEKKNLPEETKKYLKQLKHKMLTTAATDGRRFYWNPEFVNKQSKIGLRIVIMHEAWHAIYMHPSRRGVRNPGLWNIAVDYKVNFTIMEDLKARGIKEHEKMFVDNLGDYIRLEEYAAFLKDPYNPPERLKHFNPIHSMKKMIDPAYQHPGENMPPMYYAEANLSDDMKKPENIYEYLMKQIPTCPKCGKVWYKKPDEAKQLEKEIREKQKQEAKEKAEKQKADKGNKDPNAIEGNEEELGAPQKSKEQSQQDQNGDPNDGGQQGHNCGSRGHDHDHEGEGESDGQGQCQGKGKGQGEGQTQGEHSCDQNGEGQCDEQSSNQGGQGHCDEHQCDTCGQGDGDGEIDPFGIGSTLDDHLDSDISEEELTKRISDAIETTKKLAGTVPGGLEDELGLLTSPQLTWQDFVRMRIHRKRRGVGRNDWQSFKRRPLMYGMLMPQKRDVYLKILAAYDCSGSMSNEDVAHGVSQLQVVDDRGEAYLLPWDTKPYFDKMVKIDKIDKENLVKAKVMGRGGTSVNDVFNQYEKHCGKVDLIIIITDSFLSDTELKDVKNPGKDTDVVWLITSHNIHFRPPFGRVFHLKNEKI